MADIEKISTQQLDTPFKLGNAKVQRDSATLYYAQGCYATFHRPMSER